MGEGNVVISVESLSKRYFVGHQERTERGYDSFRDSVVRSAKHIGRKAVDIARGRLVIAGDSIEEFWALKDVSFQVKRGEILGVVGRNGAGKSTLLKVLSRITEPTRGRVILRGRVASLLEIGTGFHPELTGRENIFLNGAILGMSRNEIRARFDEIVSFAEIDRFLDTPVKRYSSGMYVRLAFAVAAHLEPEILLVDEVLAVGDAAFQKKCLGRMDEVGKQGRTVIFVSHQMAALQSICRSAVAVTDGQITFQGTPRETISAYLAESEQTPAIPIKSRIDRTGSGAIRFTGVRLRTDDEEYRNTFTCGGPAVFELHFQNNTSADLRSAKFAMAIENSHGQRVLYLFTELVDQNFRLVPAEASCVEVVIPKLPIVPGRYGFTLYASVNGMVADWIKNVGWFHVEPGDFYGTGKLARSDQGPLLVEHSFKIKHARSTTAH